MVSINGIKNFMSNFFKFLYLFIGFSFELYSQEDLSIIKVEVATIIWENQRTSETFKKLPSDEYFFDEVLVLENHSAPIINNDILKENTFKFDMNFLEPIPKIFDDDDNELEQAIVPPIYRILETEKHELNGTMRRISQIDDLFLSDHKAWYQPLKDENLSPFVLVSEGDNQCAVKVFKSRFPRMHVKCILGEDMVSRSVLLSKSDLRVADMISFEYKRKKIDLTDNRNKLSQLYFIDNQRRVDYDELQYFDHPKIGVLVAIYKYPAEQ